MASLDTGRQYRHIYDFDVAGSHLPERQKAVLAVNPPQSAELRREPDNPCDANAVAVYVGDEQLGYVPASEAHAIAMFLDRGELVEARVASTHWTEDAGTDLAAARLFIGIGIPDPGVESVHHVIGEATTVVNEPGSSGTENVIGAGEKMQQAGKQMQKAGLNMTACGCSVVILVVIGFVLYVVACGH